MKKLAFLLSDSFVEKYKTRTAPFGFNGLGLFTYYRTYSRIKEDGHKEQWYETVRRVVEGCYSIQKEYILNNELGWNDKKAQKSAEEMYDRMFEMKFLPPGRMLWALGTPLIHERKIGQALFNCAFVSTEDIDKTLEDALMPFAFMMDMSMVGVGVGFDVLGAKKIRINAPTKDNVTYYKVPDSREGWVESLMLLLRSYFSGNFGLSSSTTIYFDYSEIRPKGRPIKGFGGISSGSQPLQKLHQQVRATLEALDGEYISVTAITDIMNMIGLCVVAGNVRRTAQMALGSASDKEYLTLKDYRWNPKKSAYEGSKVHRAEFGWASNNSVLVNDSTSFEDLARQTSLNGEPGYIFLNNIQAYSRMVDPIDYKDIKAKGTNPCGEQSLESFELCCLVETFPSKATSEEDFLRTLKFAYLVGKTATLMTTTWHQTNRVQKRNRRIGTSVTGVTDFLESNTLDKLRTWLENGYAEIQRWDEVYSSWLCVPKSIKTTSVKPSGTVSLLAGVNPGCHFPEHEFYIRRVRVSKESSLLPLLEQSGLEIEEDVMDHSTLVISFPVHNRGRNLQEISIWEQVSLAVFLQRYWSDNQVSCTVSFRPDEAKYIAPILNFFRYSLKSISFLPRLEAGAYAQMPYEAISREKYYSMANKLRPIAYLDSKEDAEAEKFCTSDTCTVS